MVFKLAVVFLLGGSSLSFFIVSFFPLFIVSFSEVSIFYIIFKLVYIGFLKIKKLLSI